MKLVNLTPHAINVYAGDGKTMLVTVEPTVPAARCKQEAACVGDLDGVPVYRMEFGEVENLPAPQDGTFYIVSRLVATAVNRADVFCPGAAVRDEAGRVVGCVGLSRV
jgi:hypothetical protein